MSGYCPECGNQHCICGEIKANGVNAVLGDLTRDKTDELINDLFQHIKTRGPIINGMDRSVYQVVIEQWFARHFT